MAQYEKPEDPRTKGRSARGGGRSQAIPWRWLGGGILVSLLGIAASWWLITGLLVRTPLPNELVFEGSGGLTPTIIRLTAPATALPTATSLLPTVTTIPTLTPRPTPDLATPPPEITVGFYGMVANTNELGVTIRGGPGIQNVALTLAEEDDLLLIIGGPREGSSLIWWQVQLADGTEGWVAADFLVPAAAPPQQ